MEPVFLCPNNLTLRNDIPADYKKTVVILQSKTEKTLINQHYYKTTKKIAESIYIRTHVHVVYVRTCMCVYSLYYIYIFM